MSNQANDLQTLADTLLDHAAAIAPHQVEVDRLKEIFAEATTTADKPLRFASAKGMVETRRGSTAAKKGETFELDPEKFKLLPEETRKMLLKAKVVTKVEVMSRAAKPAVSVKPVLPASNDNPAPAADEAAA